MTAEDITREVFRNVHGGWKVLFYVFVVIETAIFLYGFIRLYKKYKKGKKDPINRIDKPISRLFKPFKGWDTYHQLQPGDRWTFIAHTAVVVGMILLFLGTVILTIETDFIRPIDKKFGTDLSFFWGTFYLIFSLIMELAGIAVIAGLIYLARRRRSGIDRLDYARKDGREQSETRKKWPGEDKIFLSFLFVTTMLGFILEGVRIVADKFPDFEAVSFIGLGLAHFFNLFLTPESAEVLYVVLWWTHFIITAVIVAFLPYTKAMHIVIDFISIATVDENSAKRLPKQDPAASAAGYNTINDFSWRDLVSLDACTKCGRCHVSCPAGTVGQPLSPRDLILDLRTHAATTLGTPEWTQRNQTNGNGSEQALIMVEDGQSPIILADTIWSCTTCRACVTHCPVGIEHVPLIVQMRRRMVEEGDIDAGIQGVLEKVGKYGNSFGKSNRMRTKWAKDAKLTIKDARKEEVEYLWFVGDFASFDARAIEDTQLLAKVFDQAGVNFGLLHDGEKTAGNDIRRVGEEGLFETLVEDNLASMEGATFSKIVTTDPHTLNTLRNEYPDFQSDFIEKPQESILHYTQLLWNLVESGKLQIKKKFSGTVTYHDPCYLGRYIQEYEAPRNLITALGFDLIDMPRCRENSFCCGAGGGMIWKEGETTGDRPANNRIEEALQLNVSKFVVSCPKDKVMFGDAVKVAGSDMEVVDITKLIFDALEINESPKE